MKILITGAGGMLGTDLTQCLAPKYSVIGVGRRPAPHLRIPFKVGDLANVKIAEPLIEAERPEIILHAAAMTDVDGCEQYRREALLANLETTRHVTEAGNRVGALVIFFSTDFVFDGTKKEPYREDDLPRPLNVYGETKFFAERYLLLRGRRFLILRTSWLFGRQGENFPKKILRQAEAGKPFPMVSDQFGNPTYTQDLAQAVAELLQILSERGLTSPNQIYHVTNEGAVSRYEFACAILKKRNLPTNLVTPISSDKVQRPARRPRDSSLATEKIKADFGIRLRPWEEALEAYLQEDPSLLPPSLRPVKPGAVG